MFWEFVEGWFNPGYTEESIDTPSSYEVGANRDWHSFGAHGEGFHPSADRFFSVLRVQDDFEVLKKINYLRLTTDKKVVYYGWVERVTMRNEYETEIVWHVDYWRTYWKEVKKLEGWRSRKAFDKDENDPPQEIPTLYYRMGLDYVPIGYQVSGIYWVVMTFGADGGVINTVLSGVNSIPIFGGLVTEAIGWISDTPALVCYDQDSSPAEDGVPYYPSGRGDLVCICFPVSIDAEGWVYWLTKRASGKWVDEIQVASGVNQYSTKIEKNRYYGPQLKEIVSGQVMKALGIKGDKVVNCCVSPICPIQIIEGSGREDDELKLVPKVAKNIGQNLQPWQIKISLKLIGERCLLSMNTLRGYEHDKNSYGFADVGLISKGCPDLKHYLDLYYYQDETIRVDTTDYIPNGSGYSVTIQKRPHIKYISIKTIVALLTNKTRKIGRIVHYMDGWKLKLKLTESSYGEYVAFKETVGGITLNNSTVWRFNEYNTNLIKPFIDAEVNYIEQIDNDTYALYSSSELIKGVSKELPDKNYRTVLKWDRIWLDFTNNSRFVNAIRDDSIGIYMTRFNYMVGKCFYAIQSSTTLWPIHYIKLEHPMKSDYTRDLVVIGANGEVVHKFRINQIIKGYTYEVIVAQTQVYIRLKFWGGFSMANDAEVTIPLPSLPLASNQMNEYLAGGGRLHDLLLTNEERESRESMTSTQNMLSFVGAAASIASGGSIGAAVASYGKDKLAREMMNQQAEAHADRMQQIKDAQAMAGGGVMAMNGTLAHIHDSVPICLAYLIRDDYSVQTYFETMQKTGIPVNEWAVLANETGPTIKEGPLQMRQPLITGNNLPKEAAGYIATKLIYGVNLNPKL